MRAFLSFFFLVFSLFLSPLNASIIKKPPPKPTHFSWKELPCSQEDREKIYEIVSTVSEKAKIRLLFDQSYLREKGEEITHVHPLKFLGVIFSDPYLKGCMLGIWNDYFKKSNFLSDLSSALTREANKGKLFPYLEDFAKEVSLPSSSIKHYFDSRDWESFVSYLIYTPSH